MAFTIAALAVIAIVALWFTFRYYPEKRAAERFFDALVAGDTAQAYQLWKPGPTYTMKDFLADWGSQGYYGPVKSYKILHAKAPSGSNAIAVSVEVSPSRRCRTFPTRKRAVKPESSKFGSWQGTNPSASPFPNRFCKNRLVLAIAGCPRARQGVPAGSRWRCRVFRRRHQRQYWRVWQRRRAALELQRQEPERRERCPRPR